MTHLVSESGGAKSAAVVVKTVRIESALLVRKSLKRRLILAGLFATCLPSLVCATEQPSETKNLGKSDPNVMTLLRFVPRTVESLFCFTGSADLKEWPDLSDASVCECASYFTTMLTTQLAHHTKCDKIKVSCALSAVRNIRSPVAKPNTGVANGPFVSERCELVIVPEALCAEFVEKIEGMASADVNFMLGDFPAVRTRTDGKLLFIAKLRPDILCIANDSVLLSEVAGLARAAPDKSNGSESLIMSSRFKAASSLLFGRSQFWAIRLFEGAAGTRDITNITRPSPLIAFHDSRARFITLELRECNTRHANLSYATDDAGTVRERLVKSLGKIVKGSSPMADFKSEDGRNTYHVVSVTCDLAADDEAIVSFSGLCAMFGQGTLL